MENIEKFFWGNTSYWWVILIIGLLLIPCGYWFLVSPSTSYFTITTILLWSLIVLGIIQIIIAFNTPRHTPGWGWWLGGGLVDLFVGFIMLGNIQFSTMLLPYFFSLTFLFKGIANIISAFTDISRHYTWWMYLINGILLLLMAACFFIMPFSAYITIDILIGIAFIYWGFSLISFSLDLRPQRRTEEQEIGQENSPIE